MTIPQTDEKQINDNIEVKKSELNLWQERLNNLLDKIKYFKREIQLNYQTNIEELQEELQLLQVRLQAMKEGDPNEWLNGRVEFQERYAALEKGILNTAERIQNEDEDVKLGWLQGFTNERPHDSAGWVEGMGERGPSSKGWPEGYNKQ